jgi:hypothetical protein
MSYARGTKVPISRSREEIERTVLRYKADQFGSATDDAGGRAMIQFRMRSWLVRFILPLPKDKSEQNHRERWRALLLCIKAKLETVESGITSFEEEFLPHIVTPRGDTFGEWAVPQLREMAKSGQLPRTIFGELEDKRDRK